MTILSHEALFTLDGLRCEVMSTRPEALMPAIEIAQREMEALTTVALSARPGSEAARLTRLAAVADVTAPASDLLLDYVDAAMAWRPIDGVQVGRDTVSLRRGSRIDLGVLAEVHAADRMATQLDAELPGGFLVAVEDAVTEVGEQPDGGWPCPRTRFGWGTAVA